MLRPLRRTSIRTLGTGAMGLLLAACSLVFASDLDGAREATAPGSPDATDAPARDTSTSPPFDGGVEGGGPTGCASYTGYRFCDDFDTDAGFGEKWPGLPTDPKTTRSIDSLAFSAPGSLRTTLANAAECSYIGLEREWSGVGRKRVEVRLRIRPSAPFPYSAAPLLVAYDDCQNLFYVGRNASLTDQVLLNSQYGAPLGNDLRDINGGMVPDEWTDIAVVAEPNTGAGIRMTVSLVHPSGTVDETKLTLASCSLRGTLRVQIGFHCSSGTYEARFDDVRVGWE